MVCRGDYGTQNQPLGFSLHQFIIDCSYHMGTRHTASLGCMWGTRNLSGLPCELKLKFYNFLQDTMHLKVSLS